MPAVRGAEKVAEKFIVPVTPVVFVMLNTDAGSGVVPSTDQPEGNDTDDTVSPPLKLSLKHCTLVSVAVKLTVVDPAQTAPAVIDILLSASVK